MRKTAFKQETGAMLESNFLRHSNAQITQDVASFSTTSHPIVSIYDSQLPVLKKMNVDSKHKTLDLMSMVFNYYMENQ